MPRPPDSRKREELLRGIRATISEIGLADLSLKRLATALGTSDRMLVHYFGTKENLLAQALAAQDFGFHRAFTEVRDLPSLQRALRGLWASTTTGEEEQSMRILLQAMGIASTGPGPFTDYVTTMFETLTGALTSAIERSGSGADAVVAATVLAGGFRGLLFDRLITGDVARTDAAAERLIGGLAEK